MHPMTQVASKQLLPLYDKPMVFYPISVLMLADIRDILLISTPQDIPRFQSLLGDGSRYGIRLSYVVQPKPEGIAQAFVLGADFIGNDPVTLVLGDNVFYGRLEFLEQARASNSGATIFGYYVTDPGRYGVVEFGPDGQAKSLEEKPKQPRSNHAVPGLYFYDASVVARARALKPSARGELEITDLNRSYMADKSLRVIPLGRGVAWLDTGTPDSMVDASAFIAQIERRQGLKIACLEEIALRRGFFTLEQFDAVTSQMPACPYREYLERLRREWS